MTVLDQIERARWWALSNQTYLGSLASELKDKIDPSTQTSATDGEFIYWNPSFIETLRDPEVRFVLLHETLHPGLGHLWRLPLDARGNAAGDHAINLILKDIPDIEMPEGVLCDEKYRNMAEEEILATLPHPKPNDKSGGGQGGQGNQNGPQNQSQSQQSSSQGKPSHGGHGCPCGGVKAPSTDPTSAETQQAQSEALRDKWQGHVIQAAQAAQVMQGHIPGEMQRELARILHQSVDWATELADFVHDASSSRNDWSRSARRHAWQPVIYPRKRADELGTVIFARDTSGSVSDSILAQYSALITDCISETGCNGLVIDCDKKIQAEYELSPFDTCPLTAKGGGGTDFRPVFERVDELAEAGTHIAGIVYLTDMMGRFPDDSEYPTLWLDTLGAKDAPFGRVVKVEV